MSDMSVNLITFVTYTLQMMIYISFCHGYLTPKYKTSMLYSNLLALVFNYVFVFILSGQVLLKTIVFFLFFYSIALLFYKSSIIKRITCPLIIISLIAFLELLVAFFLIYILKQNMLANLTHLEWIFISSFVIIIAYFMFDFVGGFLNHDFNLSKKYTNLFVTLSVCIVTINFIVLLAFIKTNVYGFSQTMPLYVDIRNCIALFIIHILAEIIVVRSIKRLKKDVSKELTIQSIYNNYDKLLEDYLILKDNEENIRYLKHDITNHLQTIHTINAKEHTGKKYTTIKQEEH